LLKPESPTKRRELPTKQRQPNTRGQKNEEQKRGLFREFIPRRPRREGEPLVGLRVCLGGCKNRTIPHVRRDPDRRGQPFGQDGVQKDAGGRKQPYLRPCLLFRRDRLDNKLLDCEIYQTIIVLVVVRPFFSGVASRSISTPLTSFNNGQTRPSLDPSALPSPPLPKSKQTQAPPHAVTPVRVLAFGLRLDFPGFSVSQEIWGRDGNGAALRV
jgi:hypothetical protein